MKTQKRATAAAMAAMMLAACGGISVAIAVATLGIAGAALNTYCLTGGRQCSPALMVYAELIMTEAEKDAGILASGQTTVQEITAIVAGLKSDIAQAANLPGLTPGEKQEVDAILQAATTALNLIGGLQTPSLARDGANRPVRLPALSNRDRAHLSEMTHRIAVSRALRRRGDVR